ncbi:MAG: GTPase Era [Erysipelotrichaceae bacterium]|nr:GTPase Era [Erysipelotrichaceae bacterium]
MIKSGFVGVIGRPNVGKSTLVNAIVGSKVSIVSFKPQTTRDVIKGIYNDEDSQIVFTDTPGIHKAEDSLGDIMNANAINATCDVDIILMLVDISKESNASDKYVIERIKNHSCYKILVLNKVDTKSKIELLPIIKHYADMNFFDDIIPVSALKNNNIDELIKIIKDHLPEGPRYYPITMVSDHPQTFSISEVVREKIFLTLSEELPYSIGVYTEEINEDENKIKARVIILVSRDSQKGIIIGDKGLRLKKIVKVAKDELSKDLKKQVVLDVYVRVQKNWRNSPSILKMLGYQIDD